MRPNQVQDLVQQVFSLLPEDLHAYRADLERTLRASLSAAFARMDLVTREEFDVQSALLSRTRALVDDLQAQVSELERRLQEAERPRS